MTTAEPCILESQRLRNYVRTAGDKTPSSAKKRHNLKSPRRLWNLRLYTALYTHSVYLAHCTSARIDRSLVFRVLAIAVRRLREPGVGTVFLITIL